MFQCWHFPVVRGGDALQRGCARERDAQGASPLSLKPTAKGIMSGEEPDAGLSKCLDSLQDGKPLTADEVDQMMKAEFGL